MIVDKKSKHILSGNKQSILASIDKKSENEIMDTPIQIEPNGPIDVLNTIKKILRKVTWEYGVEGSPLIFKTVQIDDGQYERIISSKGNQEETMGFPAAFVQTIQENISQYECLQERCQLQYIDPMESFDHGLQPCWMTYEVWFKQKNIWINRNKVYKKFVCPPFTNHADQDKSIEGINPDDHTNLDHPITYDEATDFIQ